MAICKKWSNGWSTIKPPAPKKTKTAVGKKGGKKKKTKSNTINKTAVTSTVPIHKKKMNNHEESTIDSRRREEVTKKLVLVVEGEAWKTISLESSSSTLPQVNNDPNVHGDKITEESSSPASLPSSDTSESSPARSF